MKTPDLKKRKKCAAHPVGAPKEPDPGLQTPDANVGGDGHCIVPPHPESARLDTGEPCDDGRGST